MAEFATSTAPADVVRRQYLASAAGDLEALRATLAPDVEWTEMAGFPLAGTYRTPDGVTANVMEKLGQDWDGWTAHDDTYVVDGENVVVLARYTADQQGRQQPASRSTSASPTTSSYLARRPSHIVRFEQFVDTATRPRRHDWAALRATGIDGEVFERIVNVLIDLQPDIRLSFSSHPTNVPEALQRWLKKS
jgi:ketosteroid isomerase-like protein